MLLFQCAEGEEPGLRLRALVGETGFEVEERSCEGDVCCDLGVEGLLRGWDGGAGGGGVVEEGSLEVAVF